MNVPALATMSSYLPDEKSAETLVERWASFLKKAFLTPPEAGLATSKETRIVSQAASQKSRQIQLSGDLGAGKTTLVRALLEALGYQGRVRSPSYTLCEPYVLSFPEGEIEIYHFDLYRFSSPEEWDWGGFREYFARSALCLVEWPEKASDLLGIPDLFLELALPEAPVEGRLLHLQAYSPWGQAFMAAD